MSDEERRDTPPQPTNPNATRDHLANERTLLAWVRTCIAIMALGFVVARFGLLIRELAGHGHAASVRLSTGLEIHANRRESNPWERCGLPRVA